MIVFKYKEESLGLKEERIKRPIANVFLKSRSNSWIEFHPYIDSGADLTMIPLSLGKLLGWGFSSKKVEQIGGVRGSVPVIYKNNLMRIGEKEFNARVAWSLIEDVPPLLGRADVFDIFEVTFKQKKGIILFS
jgi:hypothetical protein